MEEQIDKRAKEIYEQLRMDEGFAGLNRFDLQSYANRLARKELEHEDSK